MVEFIIAPANAWQKFAQYEEGLGPWTGFSKFADGGFYIQIGNDTFESNIEQCLNHEMIHYLLHIFREDHTAIDRIFYTYEESSSISDEMKVFLQGLSEYGLGYPKKRRASFSMSGRDVLQAAFNKYMNVGIL